MNNDVVKNGLLARVEDLVGSDLLEVERVFHEELESFNEYVTDVMAHVTRFRGKRLRPMLLLLSASAVGEINPDHRVLAAVVEMIHTATLVHDDVLDEAGTRRHVATVNARWNNETSVLFGDYLFTHSFHLAATLESTLACRMIGRATNIVCEGELAQIHHRGNFDLSEMEYLRIIDGKTAELCALCCFLGAHFAEAEDAAVAALEGYGRALGMAFQIVDDILDLHGSERETGKSLGTDLEKQKLTLPLIHMMDQLGDGAAARVRDLLSQPGEKTRRALEPYLEETGAVEYARGQANEFAAAARLSLTPLDDSPAKRVLEEICEFATQRTY